MPNAPPFHVRLAGGDHAAFEELFRQYWFPLRTYALRFVRSMAAAEDIVQDVFLQLWDIRTQIAGIHSLKSWLFTAVHNQAINNLKHLSVEERYQQHITGSVGTGQMPVLWTDADADAVQSHEILHHVRYVVRQLPEQTRRIFLLSRKYGLKNREIADFLNIHLKTVEKHITIALQHIRNELSQHGEM